MTESTYDKRELVSDMEAGQIKDLFRKNLKSYKEKGENITDEEWLEGLFERELPSLSEKQIRNDSVEIINSINAFHSNLNSVEAASKQGMSKERWLSDTIQQVPAGMSVNDYSKQLQGLDDFLYAKNAELSDALTVCENGNVQRINRNPNLDGILAENMIAKSTELSGYLQGRNIRVDVLESHAANSVDVRAINLDTGKYQNYQLKFGQDAKATIRLIEGGNYNNQRIIVPTEQLEDIKEYFTAKGSSKTISDHIEAWGVKGKPYTKQQMKALQNEAQAGGVPTQMGYDQFHRQELALSIGKNAGILALQSAAITTGLHLAHKAFHGETIDSDELIESAISSGADTTVKVISAGTLQVAVRKGWIRVIATNTPASVIANIATVSIENMKVISKIASGELTMTQGLDQMGRITASTVGGLLNIETGVAIGGGLTAWIPIVGIPLSVVTGFIGGMVGYFAGSKIGDAVFETGKKVAKSARTVAKAAFNGLKKVGETISNGVSGILGLVFG